MASPLYFNLLIISTLHFIFYECTLMHMLNFYVSIKSYTIAMLGKAKAKCSKIIIFLYIPKTTMRIILSSFLKLIVIIFLTISI